MEAFWSLHRSRGYLMSGAPQGLTLTEIRALLDEAEFEGEQRRRYLRYLQAMDVAYLKHCYEKIQREQKPQRKRR
jgi:hypothetical protein